MDELEIIAEEVAQIHADIDRARERLAVLVARRDQLLQQASPRPGGTVIGVPTAKLKAPRSH